MEILIENDKCLKMMQTAMRAILPYFQDKMVVEIMLNQDGRIWTDTLTIGCRPTDVVMDSEDALRFIRIVASATNTTITKEDPILSTELPYFGSRFEALVPPVVEKPVFTIRQKAKVIFDLQSYVAQEIMTQRQADAIKGGVQSRHNILVVGGTSSGKTTLVNAILNEIADSLHRIVILQDTAELQSKAANSLYLHTSDTVDMQRLLKSTMRLRPDRIVVGEVRDAAALDLLKSWNTGHPGGISTIHANGAEAGLYRLEQLIQEKVVTPQRYLIGEAVNLIVYIEHIGTSRKVQEVLRVHGYDSLKDKYILESIGGEQNGK